MPLFRRKRPQPREVASAGTRTKDPYEPKPDAIILTGELPLIYAPTSAERWLAAVTRLEEVSAYKRLSYKLLDLAPGQVALDLGCGIGDDARAIAELVAPSGRVVGVDVEAKMIEAATARQREEPTCPEVEFVRADGEQLPFADDTFDAVRIDRVLQHADDPARVLREVYRVLRPGGRLTAVEPDWKSMVIYPGSAAGGDDDSVVAQVFDWHVNQVIHPLIGRQLRGLIGTAGFVDVQLVPVAYSSYQYPVADLVCELSATAQALTELDPPALSKEAAEAWLAAMRAADDDGTFFGSVPLFFGRGLRPDAGSGA
ncbi:MAG: methyltransferase domain-containing protein [Ktedonobacterales bacterium]